MCPLVRRRSEIDNSSIDKGAGFGARLRGRRLCLRGRIEGGSREQLLVKSEGIKSSVDQEWSQFPPEVSELGREMTRREECDWCTSHGKLETDDSDSTPP